LYGAKGGNVQEAREEALEITKKKINCVLSKNLYGAKGGNV
jgi:hypothetical protein